MTEPSEPRRIDQYLFDTPKPTGGSGFGTNLFVGFVPVSKPVKAARWARYRWWNSLHALSYQLRAPQRVRGWLYKRWSPAQKAWLMAQVKHGSWKISGLSPMRQDGLRFRGPIGFRRSDQKGRDD